MVTDEVLALQRTDHTRTAQGTSEKANIRVLTPSPYDYPNRHDPGTPTGVWIVAGISIVVASLIFIGGCAVFISAAAEDSPTGDQAISASPSESSTTPPTAIMNEVEMGKAFTVRPQHRRIPGGFGGPRVTG